MYFPFLVVTVLYLYLSFVVCFQQPTLSDMTMYELNFSLLVEQMLSKIVDPSYRQIVVEVRCHAHLLLSLWIKVMYMYTCKHMHTAFCIGRDSWWQPYKWFMSEGDVPIPIKWIGKFASFSYMAVDNMIWPTILRFPLCVLVFFFCAFCLCE